jgi:LysR family transcriptional regulator, regulator of gene expression of beta-lactamase
MLTTLSESFDSIAVMMERVISRLRGEIVSLGVVRTSAVSWLLPRLAAFERAHPDIDLRISTNNNRVDIAEGGLRNSNKCWAPSPC